MAIPKLKDDDSLRAGLPVEADDYWNDNPTFEELARAQGVRPIASYEELAGGWPEDEINDGFEEALERWRRPSPWDEP